MSDQYPQDPQQPQAYGQQAYGQQPYQPPAPQTPYAAQPATMSPEDERTWGAISHAARSAR